MALQAGNNTVYIGTIDVCRGLQPCPFYVTIYTLFPDTIHSPQYWCKVKQNGKVGNYIT
jgi:hypothetical protein